MNRHPKKAVSTAQASYGNEHDTALFALDALAAHYKRIGEVDRADAILCQSLKVYINKFGPLHPKTLGVRGGGSVKQTI